MKIIFSGSGEYGLPTLKALREAGHEIVEVYTQPDRPAGRGRKLAPTPVGQYALEQNLPLIRTENLNQEQLPSADLMVVVAFGQKIAPAQVNHARLGSINLHSSRLPRHRGAAPINWAILSGDKISGNSIIRLAEKMDAGDILAQSSFDIGESETAGELHDRLSLDGAGLVLRTISDLAEGRAVETPQDHAKATIAPKLSRETSKIAWDKSADEISRTIRGLYPWPGCRVKLSDAAGTEIARLTLARSRPAESEGDRWGLGEIESTGCVRAGNAAVEIIELQPEGKKRMPLADYRRGNFWTPGLKLESL